MCSIIEIVEQKNEAMSLFEKMRKCFVSTANSLNGLSIVAMILLVALVSSRLEI